MTVPKVVQQIREKPVHVRERMLLIAMVVIALVLVFLWLFTFRLKTTEGTQKNNAVVRFGEYIGESVQSIFTTGKDYFSKTKTGEEGVTAE